MDPSFMYLASLYDIDESLPVDERIALYSMLLKEPLVREDVMASIKNLSSQLKKNKDYDSLKQLFRVCDLEFIPKELFYDDKQNVHEFSHQAKEIARRIIARWPSLSPTTGSIDHPFVRELERMGLTELFSSIMTFINRSKHERELRKRLFEEMDEGSGTCVTGHLCRLINVVRGYIGDDYEMKIPDKTHDKTVLFHLLNTRVDMIDVDNIKVNIIKTIKDARFRELKDISDDALVKYICEYTKENEDIIFELLNKK
jgi:hypothetical protein